MKQANILTSAAAYKTDHCAGRSNKFLCVYLFAQAAHAAEQQSSRAAVFVDSFAQSQTSSRTAKWQRRGGAKRQVTKYFYQALDPCTVQFSLRLGYLRLTFKLGCRKHLFDLNLNVNPQHQHQHQPQATPSPEQTIPKPPRRNGCWGLWLHDYEVSAAAGVVV